MADAQAQRSCCRFPKAYVFRLYPTPAQESVLNGVLSVCRDVYNSMVGWRKHDFESLGHCPNYYEQWYACFSCEVEVGAEPLPKSTDSVGIDVGLTHFATLSDGSIVANPRFFRADEKALAKAGRRQAKTARARRKDNKVLSRIHERIRNRRHDFVHQFARRLVNRWGTIAVENLNVKGMVSRNCGAIRGNHCLAKSISDASWSMFRAVLTQKAESAARQLVAVEPAYTSQDCSGCGFRHPKGTRKKLSESVHHCANCGLVLDRDHNAALNIIALGLQSIGTQSVEATTFMCAE